ncbi:hypothetical protein K491DRAFT_450608 [Lophiostoma macrostomum CBS 122681]|uniref:Secreted protein n=1 Tax=Lophiostoma macrostomum CBS 122681 TaxID=1314788 RepID=A0A6A6TNG2_9PLEO|nr:hypothetical protein K491DRAFT_450608 [Lophiostoma macrostomum CBS 122681]
MNPLWWWTAYWMLTSSSCIFDTTVVVEPDSKASMMPGSDGITLKHGEGTVAEDPITQVQSLSHSIPKRPNRCSLTTCRNDRPLSVARILHLRSLEKIAHAPQTKKIL